MDFEDKNVVGNFTNLREMFTLSGSRTVPVIVIGDEVIVGFHRRRIDAALGRHNHK